MSDSSSQAEAVVGVDLAREVVRFAENLGLERRFESEGPDHG